jgi:hypothetical protein
VVVTEQSSPHAIATRIRSLIARTDAGDVAAAARRLGVPIADLVRLDLVLADDSPRCRDVLAAVVLRYRADACWLLTGSELPTMRELPSAERLRLSDLLLDIGERLLAEYRARREEREAKSARAIRSASSLANGNGRLGAQGDLRRTERDIGGLAAS